MSYTLERIASLVGAHLWGSETVEVRWILTDSRSLCFPEDTLFLRWKAVVTTGTVIFPNFIVGGYALLWSVVCRKT